MKKRILVLAALLFLIGIGDANAQQANPIPTDIPKPQSPLPPLRFPAPAATYERYVQYWLTLIRTLPSRYHVAQGDADVVLLMVRDCASRVEADGYVTRGEARDCRRQAMAKLHELATPYMIQFAAEN